MNSWTWRRWTAVLGFVYVAIQVAGLVLFLVAGNPPDFANAKLYAGWISTNSGLFMGDAFLTLVASSVLIALFTGVRSIIRGAGEDWEWAGTLFFGAGLVTIAITVIGAAFEATAAFVSGAGTEPTIVRATWAAAWMALTFLYLPAAFLFGTTSYVILRAAVLPHWLGWLSAVAAILDVLASLTVFGGTGNNGPVGLLPLIVGFTPVVVWVVAVSVVLLGTGRRGQKVVASALAH
jgi:hypothetical protein